MPRKSESGKYIISASEVGSFVVCQEAWRLRELAKAGKDRQQEAKDGQLLHQQWASQIDYYLFIKRAWPHILLLILLAIVTKIIFK